MFFVEYGSIYVKINVGHNYYFFNMHLLIIKIFKNVFQMKKKMFGV